MSEEAPNHDISMRLAQDAWPILNRLTEDLELDDDQRQIVEDALGEAMLKAARIGAAEAVAQVIEQGYDVESKIQIKSDDGPSVGPT